MNQLNRTRRRGHTPPRTADTTASAEAVAIPARLFSEETVLALLNEIRWAMGYQVALKTDQNVKGMMAEDTLRRNAIVRFPALL